MFTILYAALYSDLLIFSFLYAFGSELQDIFIFVLFHFPFFQMALFSC